MLFQSGSISTFLVNFSHSLGQIKKIHIWHDISGPNPAWFLERVVVCHINTGLTWYFRVNRCFDVLKNAGILVEGIFEPQPRKAILNCKKLFDGRFSGNLYNKHLWFSSFLMRPQEVYTRRERLHSCLAIKGMTLLIASVVTSSTKLFTRNIFSLGQIEISLDDIYKGFLCASLVFPLRVLLELFFSFSERKIVLREDLDDVESYLQSCLTRATEIVFLDDTDITAAQEEWQETVDPCAEDPITKHGVENLEEQRENLVGSQREQTENDGDAQHLNSREKSTEEPKTGKKQTSDSVLHRNHSSSDGFSNKLETIKKRQKTTSLSYEIHGKSREEKASQLFSDKKDVKEQDEETKDTMINKVRQTSIQSSDSPVTEIRRKRMFHEISTVNLPALSGKRHVPLCLNNVGENTANVPSNNVSEDKCSFRVVTNIDKVPRLWKSVPHPKQLVNKSSVKKSTNTFVLKEIFRTFANALCMFIPLLATIITLVLGSSWSFENTLSWLATLAFAFVTQILVTEMLIVFADSLHFAVFLQIPLDEDDLCAEMQKKVWITKEETTYYVDDLDDGADSAVLPSPPALWR